MEFIVKDNEYVNFFTFYKPKNLLRCTFQDYKNRFEEIMPPIIFNNNISLVETLKSNIRTICRFPHAYGHDRFVYFYYLLQNPTEFIEKYLRILEETVRHQGKIWPQTYYWLVFIVELLSRDFNTLGNDKLPLEYQLYLENYVINTEPFLLLMIGSILLLRLKQMESILGRMI